MIRDVLVDTVTLELTIDIPAQGGIATPMTLRMKCCDVGLAQQGLMWPSIVRHQVEEALDGFFAKLAEVKAQPKEVVPICE